jgi:hypothetical protein
MSLFLTVALLLGGPAAAGGSYEEGELARMVEDLQRLAEREVWRGVERNYLQILDLEGVEIPAEVHVSAAYAARAGGDMTATLDRLERGLAAGLADETIQVEAWVRNIREQYGRVELLITPPKGVELSIDGMPFEPEKRSQVEQAIREMRSTGYFHGLLPAGDYALGGKGFNVVAGVDTRVDLDRKELRAEKRNR